MQWTALTRRTRAPKLRWLLAALRQAEVPCRLNGETLLAPIVEVQLDAFDRAWEILAPVDDLPDDDPMFEQGMAAWWTDPVIASSASFIDLVGAIGILAHRMRRTLAPAALTPPAMNDYQCPLATIIMDTCPPSIASLCRPMVRVELFATALAHLLGQNEALAARRCEALVVALRGRCQGFSHADLQPSEQFAHMVSAFMHGVSYRLTRGLMRDLVLLAERPAEWVVADLLRDTCWCPAPPAIDLLAQAI